MRLHALTTLVVGLVVGGCAAAPYGGVGGESAISAAEQARNAFLTDAPGRIFWVDSSNKKHHIYNVGWKHFEMTHGVKRNTALSDDLWEEIMKHVEENQLTAEGITSSGQQLKWNAELGRWTSVQPTTANWSRERGESSGRS